MSRLAIGDEVFVRREGELPSWFSYQGLPGEVTSIEGIEYTVRLDNGKMVAFYESELVLRSEWSSLVGSATLKQPDYPTGPPETIGLQGDPTRSEGGTNSPSEAPACSICEYAAANHHFGLPPQVTHCKKCHATWSGLNVIHCVQCHRTFSSPSGLEKHKTASNECRDPARAHTKSGRPYFGEPTVNQWDTTIWRQSGDGRPSFKEAT